jgi:hypothetical protein
MESPEQKLANDHTEHELVEKRKRLYSLIVMVPKDQTYEEISVAITTITQALMIKKQQQQQQQDQKE